MQSWACLPHLHNCVVFEVNTKRDYNLWCIFLLKKGNETLSLVFFISSLQEGFIGIVNGMNESWFDSDGIYLNLQNVIRFEIYNN